MRAASDAENRVSEEEFDRYLETAIPAAIPKVAEMSKNFDQLKDLGFGNDQIGKLLQGRPL